MIKINFKIFLLLIVILILPSILMAQSDPAAQFKNSIFPPSPEAANFMRYGEYPISLNKGLVSISIPIYEVKSRKLSVPISLSYHAGGIKAYDIASSVGLGWSLNAGGSISRSIIGNPDESPVGVLNRLMPDPTSNVEYLSCFVASLTHQVVPFDGQSDNFVYRAGPLSGKFVFKNAKSLNAPYEITSIPYSPIKISVNSTFTAFTIVDLDGTTHIFDKVEQTTVTDRYTSIPTTWYLTLTISPDKSDTIKFTYTAPVYVTTATGTNTLSERQCTALSPPITATRSGSFSLHASVNIASIVYNNGKVTFDYSTRLDSDANRLTAIHIFQKNAGAYSEIKRYTFNHSYFTASAGQSSQVGGWVSASQLDKRLRLDSFYEEGFKNGIPEPIPSHTFQYEAGQFPVYGSTAQDFMGYYNGAHLNKNLLFYDLGPTGVSQAYGANRNVDPLYIKAGSLKRITYPTGGFTEFELEPNQVMDGVTTLYTGGLRVKSITNNDGQGNVSKKKFAYTKWYYNSNVFNGNLTQMANTFLSITKRFAEIGQSQYSLCNFTNYGENLTFQANSSSGLVASYEEVEEYDVDSNDISIGKVVTTYNKAIDQIPSLGPNFRSDEEWKREQVANRKTFKLNGGGQPVLVKEEVHAYEDTFLDAVKNYTAFLYAEGSAPNDLHPWFRECPTVNLYDQYSWMDFDSKIYESNLISTTTTTYDVNGTNPYTTQMQYVYGNPRHLQLTRSIQSTSDNKTIFTDTKFPLDYMLLSTCDVQPCYATYSSALTTFMAQKKTCEINNYQLYVASGSTTDFNAYMACRSTYNSQAQTALTNFNNCKSNFSTCINTAINSSANREKSILIMQRDDIFNTPIEHLAGYTLGAIDYVTSAVRTDFKPWANNTTGPDLIWGFNSSTPIAKASFDVNPTPYYRKIGSFTKYNSSNNVIQQAKESDINTSFLWDYNHKYPVAEVVNASVDDIAYSSFEAEGLGNFTAIAGTQRNTVDYRTGKQSYSLSSGAISKSGLVLSTKYTISMWAKTGASISINSGPSLVPTSSMINGWQYYETVVANSATVTISGAAVIDDLRLYPSVAQMKTYTYEPLVGVTSQTDANNQTNFFEYDALGRLSVVKDDNGNIIKTYQYNYKQ